jgi:predicted metal-dependent phosphoesterase TrpH
MYALCDDGAMRIDLHTHSAISDGTDRPRDLVLAALAAGLDVLAITDHDTTAGWDEATATADEHGLRLIRGIEISTRNQGKGQHLLAYEPNPADPALLSMLAAGSTSRADRTPAILAKLADLGYVIDMAAVARFAGDGVVGKPHIADALVEAGVCTGREDAFQRFLLKGRPAHVERYQPDIIDAITVTRAAGGVPVVAHPWGRITRMDEARFADLADAGMLGIEVDHQDHTPADRDTLRGIARNLGLAVTGSSDHHGTGKVNHDLGCNTTHPDEFHRLMESVRR